MDHHDSTRRPLTQILSEDQHAQQQRQQQRQQQQQQQQQQQPPHASFPRQHQLNPNQVTQSHQAYNVAGQQFVSDLPAVQYRSPSSVLTASGLVNHERVQPPSAQLYFASGLSYGTNTSPQGQFATGGPAHGEAKSHTPQAPPYGAYVYGTRSELQQQSQQATYQQVPQAQGPQTAAGETLPSQFEHASTAQYYPGAQQSSSSLISGNYGGTQFIQQYNQPSHNTSTSMVTVPPMLGNMIQPDQSPVYAQSQHQEHHRQSAQQQHHQHQRDLQHHQISQQHGLEQRSVRGISSQSTSQYQTAIRTLFTHIRARSLREAPQLLHDMTQYLAGNFLALGLASDSESRNDEANLKLWNEYNTAWLTVLQCQLDLAQAVIDGTSREEDVPFLDRPTLERLADELVAICDRLEKHGLVDYQMGIAEDEIIEHVMRCLSQLDTLERTAQEEQAGPGASSNREQTDEMQS